MGCKEGSEYSSPFLSGAPGSCPHNGDRNNGLDLTADRTYRRILGEEAWHRLAAEVQARFSVRPRMGSAMHYSGVMHTIDLSFMGWLFAQFCRCIGSPLAPCRGRDVPMNIELQPDAILGGVSWHRTYHFSRRRTYRVRSTKCANQSGEFVEHLGRGFLMRLKLRERNGGLQFTSVAYGCQLFGREYDIPDWLTPGVTTVLHEQIAGDRFRFSLSVEHPLFGRTIYQDGEFQSDVSER